MRVNIQYVSSTFIFYHVSGLQIFWTAGSGSSGVCPDFSPHQLLPDRSVRSLRFVTNWDCLEKHESLLVRMLMLCVTILGIYPQVRSMRTILTGLGFIHGRWEEVHRTNEKKIYSIEPVMESLNQVGQSQEAMSFTRYDSFDSVILISSEFLLFFNCLWSSQLD